MRTHLLNFEFFLLFQFLIIVAIFHELIPVILFLILIRWLDLFRIVCFLYGLVSDSLEFSEFWSYYLHQLYKASITQLLQYQAGQEIQSLNYDGLPLSYWTYLLLRHISHKSNRNWFEMFGFSNTLKLMSVIFVDAILHYADVRWVFFFDLLN